MSALKTLTVSAAASELTPEQRKYNQLVGKIERARAEVKAWQENAPLFVRGYAERVAPLSNELQSLRRTLAFRLDEMVSVKELTKAERETLRELIVDIAGSLIDSEVFDEAQSAELKALYDKHADVDFDTESRQDLSVMQGLFEAMSGIDLGEADFESPEDLMRHAQRRMQEEEARAQQNESAGAGARKPKKKKPTAAQLRREREEQEAEKSVRDIFRKLASALHPDRASDEADRVSRTAMMQRVNKAYESNDLLALFSLQLEIEQIDAAHLVQATAERARYFNRVLAAQLSELQAQAEMHAEALSMEFGLDPFERLAPQKLGAVLEREVMLHRSFLVDAKRDFARLGNLKTTKSWLKQMRKSMLNDMDIDFF